MAYIANTLNNLIHQTAFMNLAWGNVLMIIVACFFLYLEENMQWMYEVSKWNEWNMREKLRNHLKVLKLSNFG